MTAEHEDDDAQLERAIAALRDQEVPPVPPELLQAPPPRSAPEPRRHRLRRLSVWSLAAAASIAAAAGLWLLRDGGDPGPAVAGPQQEIAAMSPAAVTPLAAVQPLGPMEAELDAFEVELGRLREKARLLDAIRKANHLLAQDTEPDDEDA